MSDRTPPCEPHAISEAAAAHTFDTEILAALPNRPQPAVASGAASMRYFDEDTFEALDAFRGVLLSHSRFETLLQGLCEQAVAAVPGADMAGVTLLQQDFENPQTAACSDSRVTDLDTDQYRANEGPCLEAARTGRLVRLRVDDAVLRWPTFASAVAEVGVKSVLSAPLAVDAEHAGSLNLYSFGDHGFNDIDQVLVTMLVTAVETAVWESRHTADAREDADGLRRAMETRAVIEQAKGVIMAVRGVDAESAFAVLAEQSQRENVRVTELAARIVGSVAKTPDRLA